MAEGVQTRDLLQGTCVEIEGRGVLLRGPPGAGKSDLALRLIDAGAGFVADDYVQARRVADAIRVTAPAAIAGLIEVRGVGIIQIPHLAEVTLGLVVDLVEPQLVPRLPEPMAVTVFGLELPQFVLAPFDASAAVKLRALVRTLATGGFRTPARSPS